MEEDKKLPYNELTGIILNCCFEVMKELGPGFQERVYKNALLIAMRQKGLEVEVERLFEERLCDRSISCRSSYRESCDRGVKML